MWGGRKPNYTKLRTNLRLAINRLKLLEKKKTELALKARKEIADYIGAGKEDRARIRVEHIVREDYLVEAMEIIEMYCDMLLARFGLIERMAELDPGLEEPIATIFWVTPRLVADIQELKEISNQLTTKYGKEYAEACRKNGFENVNDKVLHKMSTASPPRLLIENYMIEIAKAYNVPFEPDVGIMSEGTTDNTVNDLISLGMSEEQKRKPNDGDDLGPPPGGFGGGGVFGGGGFGGGSGGGGGMDPLQPQFAYPPPAGHIGFQEPGANQGFMEPPPGYSPRGDSSMPPPQSSHPPVDIPGHSSAPTNPDFLQPSAAGPLPLPSTPPNLHQTDDTQRPHPVPAPRNVQPQDGTNSGGYPVDGAGANSYTLGGVTYDANDTQLPRYTAIFGKAGDKRADPTPGPGAAPMDEKPAAFPDLPDVPGLPSVPADTDSLAAGGGGEDVDFDDLSRRFEELKKKK